MPKLSAAETDADPLIQDLFSMSRLVADKLNQNASILEVARNMPVCLLQIREFLSSSATSTTIWDFTDCLIRHATLPQSKEGFIAKEVQ